MSCGHLCATPWASHILRQLLLDALPSCDTETFVGLLRELIASREVEKEIEAWLWSLPLSRSPRMW